VTVSAALLILAAATATPPAVASECPAVAGQTLVYIQIFDGPPEKKADLAPDQTKKQGATTWNIWKLYAGPDGLYVNCSYGKTLAGPYDQTETIKLPATAKTCRADFKIGPKPSDLTLTHFVCK